MTFGRIRGLERIECQNSRRIGKKKSPPKIQEEKDKLLKPGRARRKVLWRKIYPFLQGFVPTPSRNE